MKISTSIREAALRQAGIANGPELATNIEKAIRKHFPKSYLRVVFEQNHFKKALGEIQIVFAVAGSSAETVNKMLQNDVSWTRLWITGMDGEGNFTGPLFFEPSSGGKISTNEGWVKVGLQKAKGAPEQILKHIDAYFAKLLKALKDNAEKIPEYKKELLKSIQL